MHAKVKSTMRVKMFAKLVPSEQGGIVTLFECDQFGQFTHKHVLENVQEVHTDEENVAVMIRTPDTYFFQFRSVM
jgi:hypothetical protein